MVESMNPAVESGFLPQRVVSVAPSMTDSLLTLGLGRYLAGVTDLCLLPDSMADVTRVGRPECIRIADVLALHPDRLLAAGEVNSAAQVEEWRQSGLPLWISSPKTVRQAVEDLRDLVMMFPSEQALQSIVWLDRSVDWMTGSVPDQRVRVFCPRARQGPPDNPQSWEAVGGGSYAGDLLFLCGAEHVFEGADAGPYPRVTPDAVMAAAPEIILLPGDPFPFSEEDAAAIRTMMPEVPAVKTGRILPVDGRLLFWPGTQLGVALRYLPELIRFRG
jgi:ABC-type Fe3+-hydroxamate transport system substrate-binding protein